MATILFAIGVIVLVGSLIIGIMAGVPAFLLVFAGGIPCAMIFFALARILENQEKIKQMFDSQETQKKKLLPQKSCKKCNNKHDSDATSCPYCGNKTV